jgi:hypothetical protein
MLLAHQDTMASGPSWLPVLREFRRRHDAVRSGIPREKHALVGTLSRVMRSLQISSGFTVSVSTRAHEHCNAPTHSPLVSAGCQRIPAPWRKALLLSPNRVEYRRDASPLLCRVIRSRLQRPRSRGETPGKRVTLSREGSYKVSLAQRGVPSLPRGSLTSEAWARQRAGDSAFAGPRSPAPFARGGASGSGRATSKAALALG